MKLNHLDLQVADVPALIRFFVDHFDLRPLTRLDSPRLAILTEDAGFTLVVQQCETGSTREAATDVTRARSTRGWSRPGLRSRLSITTHAVCAATSAFMAC
jgi:catechol 2,3-dioxygenase-like lactoylglutathione lyase family enzyme